MKPCAKKYPVAHADVFVVTHKNQIVTKKYFLHSENIRLRTGISGCTRRRIRCHTEKSNTYQKIFDVPAQLNQRNHRARTMTRSYATHSG